ncbi:LUD domain-containing protein [Hydrogenimonas sp. SS33]|uniref:LutC/YkgG family protein n=1 Tax=Hydrogenimonas leucolamina TaxID=2954236 RepID=UPI00336C026F
MNARDKILKRLSESMEPPARRPEIEVETMQFDDKVRAFKEALEAAGGACVEAKERVGKALDETFTEAKKVCDTTAQDRKEADPFETDLLIVEAAFGVAENGAVWIAWQDRYPRSLLTLSENIAVVLRRDRLVHTMQQAYRHIDLKETSYGLFLCGPSKTADIEQSLVIGAHGAMRLVVLLV